MYYSYALTTALLAALWCGTSTAPTSPSVQWSYRDPGAWNDSYRDCGGERQSPINIDVMKLVRANYPRLEFRNYDRIAPMSITNNGHTVLLHFSADHPVEQLPSISAGGLAGQYNFVQLHFHWGSDSSRGSEHIIHYRHYPAEMHIVHYNSKYDSFAEASLHRDGLAVLAVVVEVSWKPNPVFDRISEQLDNVVAHDQETGIVNPFALAELLPHNTLNFYRYDGSLTTPGCQEVVTWTVMGSPVFLSEEQLRSLRRLLNDEDQPMSNNVRPIQAAHNRTITYRSEISLPAIMTPFSAVPFLRPFS